MRLRQVLMTIAIAGLAGVAVSPAIADYCIGQGCGFGRVGWHCHGVDRTGEECWDEFDNACEPVGFPASACGIQGFTPGTLGPTLTGGQNHFLNEIRQPALPPIVREALAERPGEDEETVAHFSEVLASVERENWEFTGGLDGTTDGARIGWLRQGRGGGMFGLNGSYQRSEADIGGDESSLANLNLVFGHAFGRSRVWKLSFNATGSRLETLADEAFLYGGGLKVYFNKFLRGGFVISGGVSGQFQTSDDIGEHGMVGYGVAFGFPLGRRMAIDLDAYGASIVEPESDSFVTGGIQWSVYFTPRFGLAVGYRTVGGIEGFDSSTFTIGTGARW